MIDSCILIQARMGSSRLPGKTMMPLAGKRMLHHVVNRLKVAPISGPVIIATSDNATDDFIESFAPTVGVECFRGSEEDVLGRFREASKDLDSKYVVRATADNPMIWEGAVEHLGHLIEDIGCDYISYNEDLPVGLGLEMFTKDALEKAHEGSSEMKYREHVTSYMYTHPSLFDCVNVSPPEEIRGKFRLTVDTQEDYDLMKEIYERLYKPGEIIRAVDVISLLKAEPHLAKMNNKVHQKSYDE